MATTVPSATQMMRLGPYGNGTFGFEELFFQQGVDFFLCGHYHDCEPEIWVTGMSLLPCHSPPPGHVENNRVLLIRLSD